MKTTLLRIAILTVLLASSGLALAADDNGNEGAKTPDKSQSDNDKMRAIPPEKAVVTQHQINADGKTLRYTASAGNLLIRDDDGKPVASVFYVAYVRNGEKNKRPLTFFYNGGPGSASLWLHMGSFGPKRVLTDNASATPPAPYTLIDNPNTLLDVSDLVFIDAIGTGYSQAVGKGKDQDFWGVDEDVSAFARFITRYVSLNHRWNSPKFLYGESYGTTRSAALVDKLQNDGMAFNGVTIMSSILNYGELMPGMDRESIGNLPSYAAIAAYHHKLDVAPVDLPAFLDQARAFADGEYAQALARGDTLSKLEKDSVAQRLHAFTGLSTSWLIQANLRIDPQRFQKELLRDRRLTLGRYDARFTGVDSDAAGEQPETDPSDTGMSGAFTAAFNQYLAVDLNYHNDLPYKTMSDAIEKWNWKHKINGSNWPVPMPYVVGDLSEAMRTNPHLQVFSANGYYDLATPFHMTEYDLAHLDLDPAAQQQLRYGYYPSGHMIYLNPAALVTLRKDLQTFYNAAAPQ